MRYCKHATNLCTFGRGQIPAGRGTSAPACMHAQRRILHILYTAPVWLSGRDSAQVRAHHPPHGWSTCGCRGQGDGIQPAHRCMQPAGKRVLLNHICNSCPAADRNRLAYQPALTLSSAIGFSQPCTSFCKWRQTSRCLLRTRWCCTLRIGYPAMTA